MGSEEILSPDYRLPRRHARGQPDRDSTRSRLSLIVIQPDRNRADPGNLSAVLLTTQTNRTEIVPKRP